MAVSIHDILPINSAKEDVVSYWYGKTGLKIVLELGQGTIRITLLLFLALVSMTLPMGDT